MPRSLAQSRLIRATTAARALRFEQAKTLSALDKAERAEAVQRELRATAEERKSEVERASAQILKANRDLSHSLYVSKVHQSTAQIRLGDHTKAQEVLASIRPEQRKWESRYLSQVAQGTSLTLSVADDSVRMPRFSPMEIG